MRSCVLIKTNMVNVDLRHVINKVIVVPWSRQAAYLYLQILTSVSQPMTACKSVPTLGEATTVHVTSISKQILLTGESV